MSRRRAAWLALSALIAAGSATRPREAAAFCLTSACGDAVAGTQCVPSAEGDCGEPLRWRTRCTGFAIQEDGSRRVSANQLGDLVEAAFDAWTSVDCEDGRPPGIVVQDLGRVACDELEYNANAGNANVVVFRDERWPHRSSSHNVALTTTTFDPDTGELFDADIELNSADFELTTGDEEVVFDLESVLVHEVGHFLGIGHTDVADATMLPSYVQGDTHLRSLEPDDVAAICALYPPKRVDETCNPLPRHGFSPECAERQTEGSCTVGPPATGASGAAAWPLACAAWLLGRRLRARRACRAP